MADWKAVNVSVPLVLSSKKPRYLPPGWVPLASGCSSYRSEREATPPVVKLDGVVFSTSPWKVPAKSPLFPIKDASEWALLAGIETVALVFSGEDGAVV